LRRTQKIQQGAAIRKQRIERGERVQIGDAQQRALHRMRAGRLQHAARDHRPSDGGGFSNMRRLAAMTAVQKAPAQLALRNLIVGAQRDGALVMRVRGLPPFLRQQRVGERQVHVGVVRCPRHQLAQQHAGLLAVAGQTQHLRLDHHQLHVVRLRAERRVEVRQRGLHTPGHEMRPRAIAQRHRGARRRRQRLVEPGDRLRVAAGAGERVAQQAQRVGSRPCGGQRPRKGFHRRVRILHVQVDVTEVDPGGFVVRIQRRGPFQVRPGQGELTTLAMQHAAQVECCREVRLLRQHRLDRNDRFVAPVGTEQPRGVVVVGRRRRTRHATGRLPQRRRSVVQRNRRLESGCAQPRGVGGDSQRLAAAPHAGRQQIGPAGQPRERAGQCADRHRPAGCNVDRAAHVARARPASATCM
jgi:hypothetical protein